MSFTATDVHAAATIGYYDPYAPFSSPLGRAEFAENVAIELSKMSLESFRGAAYSKGVDLIRDIRSGRLRLAIVNPLLLWMSDSESRPRSVLVGTHRGKALCPYALFSRAGTNVRNLRNLEGRRLAMVRTGLEDKRFILNIVLDGEVRDPEYFGQIIEVPDLAGAIGTIKFRKADAFLGLDLDYRKYFGTSTIRKLTSVASSLCPVVIVDPRLNIQQIESLVALLKRSQEGLTPIIERVGLDGFTHLLSEHVAKLGYALRSDSELYKRAKPAFISGQKLEKRKILVTIHELGRDISPDPKLLLNEGDES